ncbi:MAG: cellulase family glycosylhydrolase [Treponema sp.]|jgi:hypothetical protein|nr:cellulase family glycosylhydrolase [Treponema sp.]
MNRTGNRIVDDKGRTLILRGVNLGGSSKIPSVKGESPATVSFVGRPFPPEEADDHFEKLKNWGFTFIRFVITWEALEHSGPGIYDESYIDYLRKILLSAGEKGISVLMDPHQDVWSRFTGGDGAPAWTLEKLGMDPEKMDAVGAAITRSPHGKMVWPVNYSLYAAATMFTLFFGGNVFAPEVKIEGESAKDFLSKKYIAAFRHCSRRLEDCKAIAGWGVMNEPHPGFIGYRDLRVLQNAALALGPVPSPIQAMIAASGQAVMAPVYTPWPKGWKITGSEIINPRKLSLFREGFNCPWKQAGVWAGEGKETKLLSPDHFSKYKGRFTDDFLKPFMLRFIENLNNEKQPTLFFIEGVPHSENPTWETKDPQNVVNAFHHYDGVTLFTKSYRPWLTADSKTGRIILGKKKTAALFSAKLAEAKTWARENMGDIPCFLGEFGLPFDLNNKRAYKTGDYNLHEIALSSYYDGIDENLLGSTIWNYTADNTHEEGDRWNGEDLSIVSIDRLGKVTGRAAGGWLRPYPMATSGIPLKFLWDRKRAAFSFSFFADPAIKAPTEIFLPSKWFGDPPFISIKSESGQEFLRTEYRQEEQRLFVYNDGYGGEAEIIVSCSVSGLGKICYT